MTSDRPEPLLGRLTGRITAPGRTVMIASALLFLLGLASFTVSRGKTVTVLTNAPDAQVSFDGRSGTPLNPTMWRFEHVPFGERRVSAVHRDYLELVNPIDVSLFGADQFQLDLERRQVRLKVATVPGADVLLNGQKLGSADKGGVFSSDRVPAGDHELVVRSSGYEEWRSQVGLRDESAEIRAQLQMTFAKREEVGRQRNRAFELMQNANVLFSSRNYRGALEAIEESIRLYPDNFGAVQLRERIVETINILQ
jgi:hypothetical protein